MQMETQTLELDWAGEGIAILRLTRGAEMNTLTRELLRDFDEALDRVDEADALALIVTGTGRAFCCGAHLDYFAKDGMSRDVRFKLRDDYLAPIARLFDRLEEARYPTIAAINGYALGGGCELALSCDLRIVAADASLGLPEVHVGALPGAGGVQKLARLVGRSRALEWILLGGHFEAREADAHGILYRVCAKGTAVDEAVALAERFRDLSPLAVAQSKRAVLACEDMDIGNARKFGLEALSMLIDSGDWAEGIDAFHARRKPVFRKG